MVKFALIGCGRIAKRHSELLGSNKIEGAQLIAVCDNIYKKAEEIGNRSNVPAYSNLHEMMQTEEIDVAVVLTPVVYMQKAVIELSIYGKDIMVEKPMALTLDDADAMIEACDNNGVDFWIKQNRFNVPVLKLREAHQANRFGKLILGTVRVGWACHQEYYDQDSWRGTWSMDGGVLANQASYHVDLLEWMMGDVNQYLHTRLQHLLI